MRHPPRTVCDGALRVLPHLPELAPSALEHGRRVERVGRHPRHDMDLGVRHRGDHPLLFRHAQPHELAFRYAYPLLLCLPSDHQCDAFGEKMAGLGASDISCLIITPDIPSVDSYSGAWRT